MRFDHDPESRQLLMDALGALQHAAFYLLAEDEVESRRRNADSTNGTSPLTAEVVTAHAAFAQWLRSDPDVLELHETWLCYADEAIVTDFAEHFGDYPTSQLGCPGGSTAEHWPLIARRTPGKVVTWKTWKEEQDRVNARTV